MRSFKRPPSCKPSVILRAGSFVLGGLAPQRCGEPRETTDADLSLFAGFGNEEPFINYLLKHFEERIPNAAHFAKDRRVLLLRSKKGVGLDVALAALPFEQLMIQRASFYEYPPNITFLPAPPRT